MDNNTPGISGPTKSWGGAIFIFDNSKCSLCEKGKFVGLFVR